MEFIYANAITFIYRFISPYSFIFVSITDLCIDNRFCRPRTISTFSKARGCLASYFLTWCHPNVGLWRNGIPTSYIVGVDHRYVRTGLYMNLWMPLPFFLLDRLFTYSPLFLYNMGHYKCKRYHQTAVTSYTRNWTFTATWITI